MKNDYKILGDTTIIYLRRKNGEVLETLIDTSDLPKLKEFNKTWSAHFAPNTNSFYAVSSIRVRKKQKAVWLHRYLLEVADGKVTDHKNHDTLNNKRENLRILTNAENLQNKKGPNRNNTSGVRGVTRVKGSNKWRAKIGFQGKKIHVGYFDDLKEAEKAVIEARRKYLPYSTN